MRLGILLGALLVSACASTTVRPPNKGVSIPAGTLQVTTTARAQSALDIDLDMYLLIGVIPGSIGGTPREPSLAQVRAQIGKTIVLELDKLIPQVKEQIGTLEPEFMGIDFVVTPQDARFGRISNMLGVTSDSHPFTAAGFFEPGTQFGIVLVYVDRPVVFSGTTTDEGKLNKYDVRMPAEGFYWLRYGPQPNGTVNVHRFEPPMSRVEYRLQ